MNPQYLATIQLLQQIHRQYLDTLRRDLIKLNVNDLNNIETMMLFYIGDTEMSVGELMARGIYLGSNVAYHVKKLVENGYLTQEHSMYDRRVSHVRLSEKGHKLRQLMIEIHQHRLDLLSDVAPSAADLAASARVMRSLDRFLTDLVDLLRRIR